MFDLVSDIHLDFHINKKGKTKSEQQNLIIQFANSLVPKHPSKILVIAGDLGHDNDQNYLLIRSLKEHYNYILLVDGNHDYYLATSAMKYKFERNSLLRWEHMKKLCVSLPNVIFLEGTTTEIDGIVYGGTGMWFDFTYSTNQLGLSVNEAISIWRQESNDKENIWGLPSDPLNWFQRQKSMLEDVLESSDVIITHVGPYSGCIDERYKNNTLSGCYFFDGIEYLKKNKPKVWCFGHVHNKHDFTIGDTRLVNNSLGYPHECSTGEWSMLKVSV